MVLVVVLDDDGDANGACRALVFDGEREMMVTTKKKPRMRGVYRFLWDLGFRREERERRLKAGEERGHVRHAWGLVFFYFQFNFLFF